MRVFWSRALLLLCVLFGRMALAAEPLQPEQLSVETLPAKSPHWVYIVDGAFSNEIDSRVRLFDGDTYRHLGQIDAGFNPGFILSPDGKTAAVVTTYFARGAHGARTDVVEFTDTSNLTLDSEIVLPPKHAMSPSTYFNLGYSTDSHFLYVAYITPATSFGVLDPAKKTVLGEIDTAGCAMVIASGTNRVSSLCDSGRLLTVTLDAQGKEASRVLSDQFFDADTDPLFVQGVPTDVGYTFLTFLGQVREVDLTGAQPVIHPAWSLVSASEKGHWRPGGAQIAAIHRKLGRMYVPMHVGGEGSHKAGGTEIWVFNLDTHQRIARWPLGPLKLAPVVAIQVSQDDKPLLFASTDKSDIAVFDAMTGHLQHIEQHLGETPWLFLNP